MCALAKQVHPDHGMTSKVYNLGSKWPHLHWAYVLRVGNNLGSTVYMGQKWYLERVHHKKQTEFAMYWHNQDGSI